jgi:hypothetical protein
VAIVAAIMVAIGYKYKWAILTFFYLYQLMDKTTYLNPIISLTGSFILIFLPTNCYFFLMPIKNLKTFEKNSNMEC